ncbi:unnamed protein product [Arctogadus glacialis]
MGERMIMAVFRRPVQWNMRIDIHRDKNKTNQAWKEIGEEFGLPEKDCKKRWRDLRDRYVRERRDASGTTASGSAASNRRPWCHAGLMAFIDPFVASRMTTSNMPESCENGVDESVNESEIESVHESEREAFLAATNSSMEDFVNVSVTESVMNETVANESVANESVANESVANESVVNAGRAAGAAVAPGRKRRAGRAEAPMPAFEQNLMLALERTAGPSLPTIPVVDEDHHFLLSLLPSLRRLELSKKTLLKLQIHRLIYEAEFQCKWAMVTIYLLIVIANISLT